MKKAILAENRAGWDAMAEAWVGATALPAYGCCIPDENTLHLLPPLDGARVLELGCGSGHSLGWCADQGAAELWGVDLSAAQIAIAEKHLRERCCTPHLICAPMEAAEGLPTSYFDAVYAIYSIGWCTDLPAVLAAAYAALKPQGVLIFSWDHPLMHCVDADGDDIRFTGRYADEEYTCLRGGFPMTVQNRRMSTYINALADAGFAVERLVEETDGDTLARAAEFSSAYYSPQKAAHFPLSFVIKARKLAR